MGILSGTCRAFAAMLLVAATLVPGPSSAQSTGKTIRFIAQADLRSYDPVWTTGQFLGPTAYRKNLAAIIVAPVVFPWNVEKT
jgi:hypothetical protein